MDAERFKEIMSGDSSLNSGLPFSAFLGLQILRKYVPDADVEGAGGNVIYSIDVDEVVAAGITEEDAKTLRGMNWMIDEDFDCLAVFV